MQKNKKICLVDFDGTLVSIDTMRVFMIRELLFLNPKILGNIILLILYKFSGKNQIQIRSRLKYTLIKAYNSLTDLEKESYISLFKSKKNCDVIKHIKEGNYDKVLIVSACYSEIISNVLKDVLSYNVLIATEINCKEKFKTCWGEMKIEELNRFLTSDDLKNNDITLYTDSMDDLPLIKISDKVFFINKNGEINDKFASRRI